MEKSNKVEKRVSSLFERFGLVFGIVLTLTALVIGLLSYLTLGQKTEVAAQVLACDELTTYHPEIEAKFTYAGEEVAHLWKLRVRFVNSGDKTIVGVGNQKNILGEGLNFVFPEGTRILGAEEETDTFEGSIVQTNSNEFQIQFSQWRSDEYMIGSFYIASEQPLAVAPCPTAPIRDIIDGDVVVQDLTEERPSEQMSLIDRLPKTISTPSKIIGGILAGVLVIILIIVVPWGWKDSLPFIKWKSRHLTNFIKYLDQVKPALSDEEKQMLKKNPAMASVIVSQKEFWEKFKGPKVPHTAPMFRNVGAGVVTTLVLLIISFCFISLILMLFPA